MDPRVTAALANLEGDAHQSLDEYKEAVTKQCCTLTRSIISYLATVNPEEDEMTMIAWSRSAMINCSMINKPLIYTLAETGLWGDAIRERKAVITNNYPASAKPTKKGYPRGHVNVRKHLNLPIFEDGKVVLVVGVGNKSEAYTREDVRLLEEFVNEIWKTLKEKLQTS